jgi:hypothetical protein
MIRPMTSPIDGIPTRKKNPTKRETFDTLTSSAKYRNNFFPIFSSLKKMKKRELEVTCRQVGNIVSIFSCQPFFSYWKGGNLLKIFGWTGSVNASMNSILAPANRVGSRGQWASITSLSKYIYYVAAIRTTAKKLPHCTIRTQAYQPITSAQPVNLHF